VGGWLRHLLPCALTNLVVRLVRPDPDLEATVKIVAGLILYPVCWLLEGIVAWYVGGPWLAAGFVVWLIPGGIWLLAWHGRWAHLVRQARGSLCVWRNRRRCHALLAERRAIVGDMRALASIADRQPVAAPDTSPSTDLVVSEPAPAGQRGQS
jgi:hypothetical protein